MKIKRISEHIWSLKEWFLIPIHVWVIAEEDGVTLVDAGLAQMGKGISAFIEQLEEGPLRRIVLTHGHSDHVGALPTILSEHKVPVYAHNREIPYMEGKLLYPRRKKREHNVPRNLVEALPEDEMGLLSALGSLTPYFTPGHSPGHVVYYHEKDKILLAGDLFTSRRGNLHQPMPLFTANMADAVASSSILSELKPNRIEVCHGNSVVYTPAKLEAYVQKMQRKLSRNTRYM